MKSMHNIKILQHSDPFPRPVSIKYHYVDALKVFWVMFFIYCFMGGAD